MGKFTGIKDEDVIANLSISYAVQYSTVTAFVLYKR